MRFKCLRRCRISQRSMRNLQQTRKTKLPREHVLGHFVCGSERRLQSIVEKQPVWKVPQRRKAQLQSSAVHRRAVHVPRRYRYMHRARSVGIETTSHDVTWQSLALIATPVCSAFSVCCRVPCGVEGRILPAVPPRRVQRLSAGFVREFAFQ